MSEVKLLRGQFAPNVSQPLACRRAELNAEASSLGWTLEEWPTAFDLVLGSGALARFTRECAVRENGELIGVLYESRAPLTGRPITAIVFND
jgi:hypothetical protein